MKIITFIIKNMLILIGLFLAVIIFCNWYIEYFSNQYIYDDINELPHNRVGLILGTSKWVKRGKINLYFKYRIDSAVQLYYHNKIDFIIVSGDNRKASYNEPLTMKKELVKYGIPEHKIYLDYAGLSTFDSVVRAKKLFALKQFTVISQKFHNQRAVFIARKFDTNAIGYNTKPVTANQKGKKVKLREIMARVKVFIDIFILKKETDFIGDKIIIE